MSTWPMTPLGALLLQRMEEHTISEPFRETFVTVRLYGKGAVRREVAQGKTPVMRNGYRLAAGDLVYSRIDARNGAFAVVPRELSGAVVSKDFPCFSIRRKRVHPSFLIRFLGSNWFYEQLRKASFGTTNRQRIGEQTLLGYEVPLPPLPEQERIVRILDEAEALRRLRQQADERCGALIASVYSRVFLQAKQRQLWRVESIGDLSEQRDGAIRTGPFGSQLLHSEFIETGVPVLGIENVVTNEFRWTAPRCIPDAKYRHFERFRVFPGDVLVTIMGTVGRSCVAPDDLPLCMSTKHLCVITPDATKIHPRFLWAALLFDPEVRRQTGAVGGGAIMEGWNSTIIRELEICIPSIALQHAFAAGVADIRRIEVEQARSRQRLDDLFQSLLHRAFQGEQ